MTSLAWVSILAFAISFTFSYSERTDRFVAKEDQLFKDEKANVLSSLQASSPSTEHVKASEDAPKQLADQVPELADVLGCLNTVIKIRWSNAGENIGSGKAGSVWVVQDVNDDKAYALKIMRVRKKTEWMQASGGVAVSLDDFSAEVAAQTLAATQRLAPKVIDYWVCRHNSEAEPTLGFIVMEKIEGTSLKVYATEVQQKGTDVWCQRKVMGIVPTLKGYIPQETYQQILHGVEVLDQGGLYIHDLHVSNMILEDDTNRVVFIDFGGVTGCEHKSGHAQVEAMNKLGCPVETKLVELVRAQENVADELEMNATDRVFMKGTADWWNPDIVITQSTFPTFTVVSQEGKEYRNVARADLFKFARMECKHDQDNGSDGNVDFDELFSLRSGSEVKSESEVLMTDS